MYIVAVSESDEGLVVLMYNVLQIFFPGFRLVKRLAFGSGSPLLNNDDLKNEVDLKNEDDLKKEEIRFIF